MERGQHTPVAVLLSRVRLEEKHIFACLERRGIPYRELNDRSVAVEYERLDAPFKLLLNRSMSHTVSRYAAHLFEACGVTVVNRSHVMETCGDKILTSLALTQANVPTPRTAVALTPEAALDAIENIIGYPAVLKPASGSWGRLLARVNDRDAAEALLEHKQVLGSPAHWAIYIQEYVAKPGRDIRTIVIGDRVISAMYRYAQHWVTNTARGAATERCPLTDELEALSLQAARAVGGGALAVDAIERPDGHLLISEVNHTMEFHGMMAATHVDVADAMVDYALQVAGL